MKNLVRYGVYAVCFIMMTSLLRVEKAHATTLSSTNVTVTLSDTTGQIESLSDRTAKVGKMLAQSEDRYDLEGRLATEADDVVESKKQEGSSIVYLCRNAVLGLTLQKRYELRGNSLIKTVKYGRKETDTQLLRVASRSLIDDKIFKDGYYYVPTEDGYAVTTVPFIAGPDVKEPVARLVHTGEFVYYLPRLNRVFAHYRYKVNDDYFYTPEADRGIESQFLPGGGIAALGEDFVGGASTLTLESHYVLLAGDPRDYHKHLVAQPPYSEHRGNHVPSWFPKAKMFFPDLGTGRGLIENREEVGRDVLSLLKLLPQDQDLMVFFNHWSTSGDYPYQGTFRYWTYDKEGWSKPVPIEKLKENIRWLKALSPRIKVGGYFFFTVAQGTYPLEKHEDDWFIYNQSLKIESGGDGLGWTATPDFSSGYRGYLLDQLQHALTDIGFDWLHLDTIPYEQVNWKTKNVVQSSDHAKFYFALSKFAEAHDKALVENYARSIGLWAQGSYVEVQQPDRWEQKDWRILGVSGYLGGLYRRERPEVWQNLVYGTQDAYGLRNAFGGMRSWMRGNSTRWRWMAQGLAYERVIDELLENPVRDVEVHPSWWRLETDKLEAQAFGRDQQLIIPLIRHDDKAGVENVSLNPAQAGFRAGQTMFGMDFKLMPSTPLDVFASVPGQAEYIELTDFKAQVTPNGEYSHRMNLEPRRNYYHVLTAVPAWVYSVEGQRTSLLLPENNGVRIDGSLKSGAADYQLTVSNKRKTATILAYLPAAWKNAKAQLNGASTRTTTMNVRGQRCLLITIPQGESKIALAQSAPETTGTTKPVAYQNPSMDVWRDAAERLFYTDLSHRAATEDGKSVLALRAVAPATGGTVGFSMGVAEEAGGFALKMKGTASGGKIVVSQAAGDLWNYTIADDFTGWKEFKVYREQMATTAVDKKWGPTTFLTIGAYPAAGQEMTVADIKLLPARDGDIVKEAEQAQRSVTIPQIQSPPVIDGLADDDCWKQAATVTDFQRIGGGVSDSKTRVRLCHDEKNLYVWFENPEPIASRGAPQERDTQIWNADHVELFVQPAGGEVSHFLVDPAGTIQDFRWTNAGRNEKWNGDFQVKTTLNWQVGWTAEFAIPFATLGKTPQAGETWHINFARKDLSGEWSNWATDGEWLDPAGFGEAIFAGEKK